jgi:molybdopterin molybdotransferase
MSLISVREAQQRILSHFKPVETEMSSLNAYAGRVLAADIISSDLSRFDNSSVDGFAVIASDVATATSATPLNLERGGRYGRRPA